MVNGAYGRIDGAHVARGDGPGTTGNLLSYFFLRARATLEKGYPAIDLTTPG